MPLNTRHLIRPANTVTALVRGTIVGLLWVSCAAVATDVYQSRDVAGRLQFSDKPPTPGATPVPLKQVPGPTLPPESVEERQLRTQRLLDEYATERSERKAEKAKEHARLVEHRRVRAEARDQVLELESASRLYTRDTRGNKQILPEVELRKERERARSEVKRHCADVP
ncbi:MAG: DUF4124 domain-containing protein [Gammaproteobacteria bacterium]|nr:DUF4124 domain-containing protein [Gammaproteobacteria bacterium]